MRQIKFRVWQPPLTDKETGAVLPGFMDYEFGRQKLLAIRTETKQRPADFGFEHATIGLYFINKDLAEYGDRLMQFTGLLDKNGKEIWEGDIVKHVSGLGVEKIKGHVVFADGAWRVERCDSARVEAEWLNKSTLKNYARTHIVCGNIYENKELLK